MDSKTSPQRLLVRVSEAAELLSIARSKAYLMAQSGELPSIKIGKSIRVPISALNEWVKQRENDNHVAA